MGLRLESKVIAFLAAPEGVEESDLLRTWTALAEAGAERRLVSTVGGTIQCLDHLDRADTIEVGATVEDVRAADFDGLVVPGGLFGADALRSVSGAVSFTRGFFELGRPVAAIGHAPWVLVDAGTLPGRTVTAAPSVRTDIHNAGALWSETPVVHCTSGPNSLLTGVGGAHLDTFCDVLVDVVAGASPRPIQSAGDTDPSSRPVSALLWP